MRNEIKNTLRSRVSRRESTFPRGEPASRGSMHAPLGCLRGNVASLRRKRIPANTWIECSYQRLSRRRRTPRGTLRGAGTLECNPVYPFSAPLFPYPHPFPCKKIPKLFPPRSSACVVSFLRGCWALRKTSGATGGGGMSIAESLVKAARHRDRW